MKSNFKLSRVAASVAVAITGLAVSQVALAGPGYVTAVGPQGTASSEFRKPTFFAYSPSGMRLAPTPEAAGLPTPSVNGINDTGKALRKFVDPLPLPRLAGTVTAAPTLSGDTAAEKYIPVAVSSKWRNPQGVLTEHDYFEIAVVEYAEKFHSDLRKATTLRGYVQLDHVATYGTGTLPGSKAVTLNYPNGGGVIMVNPVDANGKLTGGAKIPAKFVDYPHFLGPVIAATKDTPTRLKVHNLLPVGRAEYTQSGSSFTVTKRNGDLFLPVDRSILGAGVGPDGVTEYTQNRASVHLHGGDTPWISDGTPHQWITPAGENDLSVTGSLASEFLGTDSVLDPSLLPNYLKGASTANVPDMNDPGDGAMTLYFPNGQSARFIWYHDHTFGSTRLNVYAGMASAYLITDPVEQGLVSSGALPPPERTIPMVLQDRTFVPDDIALQDARWNTSAWGQPGDSWFPHVYETVQDPAQANNWNAVGRWHYGPWFWPVFPALYALPEGTYSPAGMDNTVTTTPEAWNDTPIINGVAYPTLEVDPTTYRFRLLNAANDRMMTFNLFEAKTTAKLMDGNTVTTDVTEPGGSALIPSEIDMIPAAAVAAADACPAGDLRTSPILDAGGAPTGKFCIPETWPTDGRIGGVPAPEGAGPTIYQIASEGGWLPKVAVFEPTPINYVTDKGRIVVLNVDLGRSGLFLAPAERADIVVDFSQYAGKTLLVYNDSGAPVPAGDPRNDLFTGIGDQSDSGGAEDTKPGYGPNTRTMMRIKVKAAGAVPAAPLDPAALDTAIHTAYFSDPDRRPIVAQDVYSGYDSTWAGMSPTEMYGDIYLGSLRNPVFTFTAGTPSTGIASILIKQDTAGNVIGSGKGYMKAPLVNIPPPTGTTNPKQATGLATLKLDTVTVTNPGSGYTSAPLVTFVGGGGTGATGGAFLSADPASVLIPTPGLYRTSVGGPTYTGLLQVSFSVAPAATPNTPAGVRATGYAKVVNGAVTEIVVTNAGKGYVATPLISVIARRVLANPDGTAVLNTLGNPTLAPLGGVVASTVAKATIKGVVDSVVLYATDHTTPAKTVATKGGGGYTDLNLLQINLRNGLPLDALGQPIGTPATATATGKVFDVTLTHPGSGYEGTVAVTFTPTGGETFGTTGLVAAEATVNLATTGAKESYLVKTKAIQELFDPTYGRLNATLGVEIPFTSALTQTTIPLGYVDENTEEFADGETQIWKITHNGVDSHPVHFHLLNVQVINRVGWDGFIQPAEPREMGWKETVMMSPLEDIIVAVRAKKPTLPGFGVPLSQRLLDPTQPEGSPFGFTQIDPVTGNPKVVTNRMQNFGWEYVWHCHILGHEENDFMRPIIFNANELTPLAPTINSVNVGSNGGATVNFTDASSTEFKFSVRRAPANAAGVPTDVYAEVGTDLALSLTPTGNFASSSVADTGLVANQFYSYQVAAVGAAGEGLSNTVKVSTYAVPAAVTGLIGERTSDTKITLSWTNAQPATGFRIVRTDNFGSAPVTVTVAGDLSSYVDTVPGSAIYTYAVTAINGDKTATSASTVGVTIPVTAPEILPITSVTSTRVRISWIDRSVGENNYLVQRSSDGGLTFNTIAGYTSTTSAGTGATMNHHNTTTDGTPVVLGTTYTYRVVARRVAGAVVMSSAPSATATVAFSVPGVPTALTPSASTRVGTASTNQVVLNWTPPAVVPDAPAVTSGRIQWSSDVNFSLNVGTQNFTANNALSTVTANVPRGTGTNPVPTQYYFRVRLTNAVGNSANSVVTGPVTTK